VWRRNVRKQTIKTAKLHFLDSGLMCFLLGIRSPEQLATHPLRGAVFETWVVSEIYKARANAGLVPALSHYRETRGAEIDVLVDAGRTVIAVEAKSGATIASDFFHGLDALRAIVARLEPGRLVEQVLVYGGDQSGRTGETRIVPWRDVPLVPWGDH
jgi:predicted AAA+ superfamily ATPase